MTNDERMTTDASIRDEEDAFWSYAELSVVREEPEAERIYDLEERTARFGEGVINFAKTIPPGPTTLTKRFADISSAICWMASCRPTIPVT